MKSATDFLERYGRKVHQQEGGCWLWVGCKSQRGYGVIRRNNRLVFAHRVAYEAANGPMPLGSVIDHLCRVHCCVNPSHLEAVSQKTNVLRGDRAKKLFFCKRGHSLDPSNVYESKQRGGRIGRACRRCALDAAARRYLASRRFAEEAREVRD